MLGGSLAMLDRMDQYPKHRHEQVGSLQRLVTFAQKHGGVAAASRAVLICLRALQNFPDDPDIAAPAFVALGYCVRGKSERKVRNVLNQNGIVDICQHYMQTFRSNGSIIGAITVLRAAMPKYIPQPPAIVVPKDEEDDEDASSDEEEKTDNRPA